MAWGWLSTSEQSRSQVRSASRASSKVAATSGTASASIAAYLRSVAASSCAPLSSALAFFAERATASNLSHRMKGNGREKSGRTPVAFSTFQAWMRIAPNAGTDTSSDAPWSTRYASTTICEKRSTTTDRALSPRRLVFFCQNSTSDLNARNSKSRWSTDASIVTARSQVCVSAMRRRTSSMSSVSYTHLTLPTKA